MRGFLVVLVILGLAAAGAYVTRPNQGFHRGLATALMKEGRVMRPAADGKYAFDDFLVATRSTMTSGGKNVLQCWGAFTRFLCVGPAPEAVTPPAAQSAAQSAAPA